MIGKSPMELFIATVWQEQQWSDGLLTRLSVQGQQDWLKILPVFWRGPYLCMCR